MNRRKASQSPMNGTTIMRTEHDTQLTSEPVCPHCGHRHTDAWEWNFGPGLEGERQGQCDSCGGDFLTERKVTVYYTTMTWPIGAPRTPQPADAENTGYAYGAHS